MKTVYIVTSTTESGHKLNHSAHDNRKGAESETNFLNKAHSTTRYKVESLIFWSGGYY